MIAEAIDLPQSWNQTFNVGADQPYSLLELAKAVAAAMGVEPRIRHLEPRHEVQHAHSSHDKAHGVFGIRPQTTLEAGLARMAAWVRAHGARSSAGFEGIEITRELPAAWQTR
jgi:UDP-glucose 4-epimerase